MTIDWNTALYDPLFGVFGVVASLDTGGGAVEVTVIDQTAGVQIAVDEVGVPDFSPAALIRASEMADKNITDEGLLKATLTIRGTAWTIDNMAAKPGPDGAGTGEYMLILVGDE